jgi:hypothetical protein
MSARKSAERIIATMKRSYGAPQVLVATSESEFAHLDLDAYRSFRHTMERQGYRFLSDVKIVGISDSPARWLAPWMIRMMVSRDGATSVGYYQAKPRISMRLTNLLAGLLSFRFIATPRLFLQSLQTKHYCDFESELAGTYVTTSNSDTSGKLSLPSSVEAGFSPYETSVDELRVAHETRVAAAAQRIGAEPTRMATLEDVLAMHARLQECKNAHRAALNWITQDELRALSRGKTAVADAIFDEVQKLLPQASKPPLDI